MSIRFICRNGHILKADVRHAGRKSRCPRCQVSVWVPQPAATAQVAGTLTDTQAVRLLGTYSPSQRSLLAAPAPSPTSEERACPKCQESVPTLCRVCPACNTYLGTLHPGP
jgi:hypothetical protein